MQLNTMSNYSARRINTLLESLGSNSRYLEIGVETGQTFFSISATFKTAVDPILLFDIQAAEADHPDSEYLQISSDHYI